MAWTWTDTMLRIRKIVPLQIPKDKLEYLQKIIATGQYVTDKTKHNLIKRITNYSPCYMCGGIPKFEVIFDEKGAKRLQYYCDKGCLDKVLKREAEEPSKNEDIPNFYGCTKVDEIPHTKLTYY
jgi:hypothetical protein